MTNICLWMVYMQILGTSLVSKGKIKEIMHCGRFCPAEQYLNAVENESYTSLVLVSWIQFATSAGGLDDACRSGGVFKDSFTMSQSEWKLFL